MMNLKECILKENGFCLNTSAGLESEKKILDKNPDLLSRYVPDGLHPNEERCRKVVTPAILKALGV